MLERIKAEPVAFWGILTALVEAIIGLALIFGWVDWTAEQVGAIMLVVAVLGTALTFFVRGKVTPV